MYITAFYILIDLSQNVLEGWVFRLVCQYSESLDKGKTRVNHGGKLSREDNDIFIGDLGLHESYACKQILRLWF